ncbi:MAG: hypothetical protein IKC11_05885 [Clostridia bacterium]|nr:hypothetical protein [Clostridia bacterium]
MIKKTLKYLLLIPLICFSFLFTGCKNEDKTLARNLDDTVANLVYSVSSLDWADQSILEELNNYGTSQQSVISTNENARLLNINESNQTTLDTNIENSEANTDTNNNEPLRNNHQPLRTPTTHYKNTNLKPRHYRRRLPHHHANNDNLFDSQDTVSNSLERYNNYPTKNISLPTKSNGYYNLNTTTENNNIMMVAYSTESIENKETDIQETITNLINQRANVLLYINDLYKGYVNLTNQSKQAINAYINIIKDNTSYLNSNRGMIRNQINHAKSLASTNNTSPLINAYIIRTNETIQTRLAKIDSSILAIESICDILSLSLTENSPNFNKSIHENSYNNLTNNTNINNTNVNSDALSDNIYNLENRNQEDLILNTEDISTTQFKQTDENKINKLTNNNKINDLTNTQNGSLLLKNKIDNTSQNLTTNKTNKTQNIDCKNCTNCEDCPDCCINGQIIKDKALQTECIDCPTTENKSLPIKNKDYPNLNNTNITVNQNLVTDECENCPVPQVENKPEISNISSITPSNTLQNTTNNQDRTLETDIINEDTSILEGDTNNKDCLTCFASMFIDKNKNNKSKTINNQPIVSNGYVINRNEKAIPTPYIN